MAKKPEKKVRRSGRKAAVPADSNILLPDDDLAAFVKCYPKWRERLHGPELWLGLPLSLCEELSQSPRLVGNFFRTKKAMTAEIAFARLLEKHFHAVGVRAGRIVTFPPYDQPGGEKGGYVTDKMFEELIWAKDPSYGIMSAQQLNEKLVARNFLKFDRS